MVNLPPTGISTENTPSFDEQAEDFERRAGLPESVISQAVQALMMFTKLDEGRCFEVGAGTGEIGSRLLEQGVDYFAIDRSSAMLEVFADRIALRHRQRLHVGDANRLWPVADRSLRVVFLSRVAHLLDTPFVASEVERTAKASGCWLVQGRRAREQGSVRVQLRQRMHKLLAEVGIEPRSARRSKDSLTRKLEEGMGPASRASKRFTYRSPGWSVTYRPVDALQAWRSKSGLAGIEIDLKTKESVLDQLAAWARLRYGNLQSEEPSEEWYELHGMLVFPKCS